MLLRDPYSKPTVCGGGHVVIWTEFLRKLLWYGKEKVTAFYMSGPKCNTRGIGRKKTSGEEYGTYHLFLEGEHKS